MLDDSHQALKSALLELTEAKLCNIQFTANQGIIVAAVKEKNKKRCTRSSRNMGRGASGAKLRPAPQ